MSVLYYVIFKIWRKKNLSVFPLYFHLIFIHPNQIFNLKEKKINYIYAEDGLNKCSCPDKKQFLIVSHPIFRQKIEKFYNNKKNILFIGQEQNDVSIEPESPLVTKNNKSFEKVKQKYSDSNLYYMPQLVVISELEIGKTDSDFAHNNKALDTKLTQLNEVISTYDQVNVMHSQSGFNTLFLNQKLGSHDLPFYSNWILEEGKLRISLRNRKLYFKKLTQRSLTKYTKYLITKAKLLCNIEDLINIISDENYKWQHSPLQMQNII